jgi:hypothetical protein
MTEATAPTFILTAELDDGSFTRLQTHPRSPYKALRNHDEQAQH